MSRSVIIIAEAGVNHNGSLELAKELIDIAAAAGADYVKFQTYRTDQLVSRTAIKAVYQKDNMGGDDDTQYNMLKNYELKESWHQELKRYSEKSGIGFLSSAFDIPSIDFLDSLGLELFKIPSGEITNKPYLEHVAQKGKPVILSTGMSDMEEIKAAVEILENAGLNRKELTLLHCNTQYPTPYEDVNLKAMAAISEQIGVDVGYSDHTEGIEISIAATALGATVIEKHFTKNRQLPGPDHLASLEPDELKHMVAAIRHVESGCSGSGDKRPSASELPNREIARKSIHLARPVRKGEIIESKDLLMLRPGNGISPMRLNDVVGKHFGGDFEQGHQLAWDDLTT